MSMNDIAIRIDNISKRYRIGQKEELNDSFFYTMLNSIKTPVKNYYKYRSLYKFDDSYSNENKIDNEKRTDIIWALKKVSFEVKKGEVLGIIGKNGAGKSTLLKILSKITNPTGGSVEIRGKVSSLLEVGTGFHPELTGRENVYLNGTILGMTKKEVDKKFDEIVDFSGVEKFIDTPVKRYSSGMQVRLAFSVAAHLEPEILLVDEVLAVGDAEFQKKCFGKMDNAAKRGRTIIFVSHNMAAIENLCYGAVVMDSGKIKFIGSQKDAISNYLNDFSSEGKRLRNRTDRIGTGEIKIIGIEVRDKSGNLLDIVSSGQDIDICLIFENINNYQDRNIKVSVDVRTALGQSVFSHHNRLTKHNFDNIPEKGAFICRISKLPLPAGKYIIGFSLLPNNGYGEYLDFITDASELNVVDGDFFGTGEIINSSHGICLVQGQWHLQA